MGVLVVGPESVTTQAIVHVLRSVGYNGRAVSSADAAAAAAAGTTSSVVYLPGPGVDPSGVIEAMRDRPDLQLIVVSETATAAPGPGRIRPVVVSTLETMINAVADHKGRHSRHGLTSRHVRILQQLADGHSPTEAADHLGITVKTLNNHLGTVYKRLGARNVTQAVLIALRSGAIRLT